MSLRKINIVFILNKFRERRSLPYDRHHNI